MKFLYHFSILFFLLLVWACDIKDNKEVVPTTNFLKIYESEQFSRSYIPLDIEQTPNGGYLILGATRTDNSDFFGVYLMSADSLGNFVAETVLPNTLFVNPLENLIQIGQNFYFFCMNNITLQARLMRVGTNLQVVELAQLNAIYPLAASQDGNTGFLLQHYNRDERKTYLSKVSINGEITQSKGFDVGLGDFDIEPTLFEHLIGTGKRFPFLTGNLTGNNYFFNGFYNYTFSMVFVNFNATDDVIPGVVQGFRDERGISAALPLSGNVFAMAKFGFGQNVLIPRSTLNTSAGSIASSSDLIGFTIPELKENTRIILKKLTILGQNILLYGASTRSGQIALYAYNEADGVFLGAKYLGATNPYEIAGCTLTSDGGLAVCGKTYVAGKFARICLFKLSESDLQKMIGGF